ncbi:methyltransferase domain-containing protein [Neobacillus niacini]|uniref:methyltransferase domain-containing protein n=1 Tax=Neobacillus niacini TaxID=86668 RepID=UPI001C8D8513|nr:methyltransferase domain-containing protein [Neobacillus niacini]MBY0145144.1 methyltransferase domain-containing protein [Neobacillus niacini]
MKKPLDRITEAYFGEMGEAFSEKVRGRIHWVCENAKGETILDVGCSQGITSIILGREGKKVMGIDLLQDSIDFATEMLAKEEEATRNSVEFRAVNFMQTDFGDQTFDSIIFGEVLEHITDPQRFINKALTLLNTNGSLIITLPFGINDYFDHKKTYYLMDLLKLKNENGVIQDIKFFGKWIGAVLKKNGDESTNVSINDELISKLEDAFYTVERDLLQQIKSRVQKIKTYEDKIKGLSADITKVKDQSSEQLAAKNTELDLLKNQLNEKDSNISFLNSTIEKNTKEKEEVIASLRLQLAQMEKEKEEVIASLRLQLTQMEKEKEETIASLRFQSAQMEKEKEEAVASLRFQLAQLEQVKEETIESLRDKYDLMEKEKDQVLESMRDSLEQIESEKEDLINKVYSQINDAQVEQMVKQKDEKINTLNAQLKLKDQQLVKLQQKEKQQAKQVAELEEQVVISKKEKIHVQETLYKAYTKEEKLLNSYQKLLKRYNALSESKLGKLTLTYWKKRRNVMGGK